MTLPLLIYPPVRDGYQFTPGYGVIETKLAGGQSRKRLDVFNASNMVQMSWILQAQEYTDFMGFFENTLQNGSLDFKMPLLGSVGAMVNHVVRCIGGSPQLTANAGQTYFVSGTFEVDKNPTFGGTLHFVYNGSPPEKILDPAWSSGVPTIFDQIQVGDSVQVFFASILGGAAALDGTYVVTGAPGSAVIEISGAHLINSAWVSIIPSSPLSLSACGLMRLPP